MINATQEHIENYFRSLQDEICSGLETLDGTATFQEDLWQRPEGGGGRTRIIEGHLIERGGVNFSAVHGPLSDQAANALKMEGASFYATGVSIVLHPKNPMVPIIHMNVRYFALENGPWWFGGGIDLTPHYVDPTAARLFHQGLKAVCDKYDSSYYPGFKEWADRYFYVKHRQETRGIGGIFFDRLNGPASKEDLFAFVREVGESFVPLYTEQVAEKRTLPYGEAEMEWQKLRRGRYVEFNLVWDRGTKFGLETGGRTESILMSLPPLASWTYDYQAKEGSKEASTLEWLKPGVDWLN